MSETGQWYVATNGKQQGPMPASGVLEMIRGRQADRTSYVFAAGGPGASWVPITSVAAFAGAFEPAAARPPPPPAAPGKADEIDYEVFGEEMQFVEITLDPGEACISEAGAFMFMEPGIELETIFGDGARKQQSGGFLDSLLQAGKRVLTGESLFMTAFGNRSGERRKVAFAAPYAGRIIPLDLRQYGGTIICQRDAFLCAAKGISIGIEFQKRLGAGFFGGEGFILQKLEGDGLAFIHAGGTIVPKDLKAGETLRLDTGCLVAMERSVTYDVQYVGNVKTALFGGEGVFLAALTGPGRVWIQSLPFSRVADKIASFVMSRMPGQGSGGLLGGALGGFGDRD
jgi:uncharacterized protein (TIGR00266 family)